VSAGPHQVQVRDVTGCNEFIITLSEINIFGIPKYFSPNGDGYHETWIPHFSAQYVDHIYIFDRYGKLLAGFPGAHKGWDGNYNGHALPATDYWFVLEMKGGGKIKGHFSLIR